MKPPETRPHPTGEPPLWPAYNELAWVDTVLAHPGTYAEDSERILTLLKEHAQVDIRRLLHLGCGAGGNDFTFKKSCQVTGADLSPGMLDIARRVNPEAEYLLGDMRSARLGRLFDAVVIPDAIDYMVTEEDLTNAFATARAHLVPGGAALFVGHVREEFRENNFAYSGAQDDLEVTVFENNRIVRPEGDRYEATLVYLIRRSGRLEIRSECHTLGLFPEATWLRRLQEAGFEVALARLDHSYDPFLLGDGEYCQRVFIGRVPLG